MEHLVAQLRHPKVLASCSRLLVLLRRLFAVRSHMTTVAANGALHISHPGILGRGFPNSWMVDNGKSMENPNEMDDLGVTPPPV